MDDRFHAHIYQDILGEWRWRLVANNGQIVATSGESYVNRSHAAEMVEAIFAGTENVRIEVAVTI